MGRRLREKAKCEGCGTEVVTIRETSPRSIWPKGWVQCGTSKYGETYQSGGCSWWCPNCVDKK